MLPALVAKGACRVIAQVQAFLEIRSRANLRLQAWDQRFERPPELMVHDLAPGLGQSFWRLLRRWLQLRHAQLSRRRYRRRHAGTAGARRRWRLRWYGGGRRSRELADAVHAGVAGVVERRE